VSLLASSGTIGIFNNKNKVLSDVFSTEYVRTSLAACTIYAKKKKGYNEVSRVPKSVPLRSAC